MLTYMYKIAKVVEGSDVNEDVKTTYNMFTLGDDALVEGVSIN